MQPPNPRRARLRQYVLINRGCPDPLSRGSLASQPVGVTNEKRAAQPEAALLETPLVGLAITVAERLHWRASLGIAVVLNEVQLLSMSVAVSRDLKARMNRYLELFFIFNATESGSIIKQHAHSISRQGLTR